MNGIGEKLVTIGVAIVGVATLAVLMSRNANTAGVIQAGGNAFAQALGAAVAPVTMSGGYAVGGGLANQANSLFSHF